MALSFNSSKLESFDPLKITRWIEGRGNMSFMENDVERQSKANNGKWYCILTFLF